MGPHPHENTSGRCSEISKIYVSGMDCTVDHGLSRHFAASWQEWEVCDHVGWCVSARGMRRRRRGWSVCARECFARQKLSGCVCLITEILRRTRSACVIEKRARVRSRPCSQCSQYQNAHPPPHPCTTFLTLRGWGEVTNLNFNLGKVEIETSSTRVFNLAALSRAPPELSMEINRFESYFEVKIALTTVKIG